MKLALLLGSSIALGAFGIDLFLFAPPPGEPLQLSTSASLRSNFDGGSILIGDNEMPPEAVIEDYDEERMSGELELAVELRAVRESDTEHALWLAKFEHQGEPREALAGLELEQGVRFQFEDEEWSATPIDADGEPLDGDVEGALSSEANFASLFGAPEAAVEDEWTLELTPAAAFGLMLPGIGFNGLVELLPVGATESDEPGLARSLRAALPETLSSCDASLELECRYASRDGDLAVIEYAGDWTLTLDLSEPFSKAIRVGGDPEEAEASAPPETSGEAQIELEPSGQLVWDLRTNAPVEHTVEADWSLDLLIEALAAVGGGELPISGELAWEGTLNSATTVE